MSLVAANPTAPVHRVLVADDHAVVRKGLAALIEREPDWEVCAEVANGREAVRMAAKTRPDIIVMDLSMPVLGGVDATMQIRKMLPLVEVLVFTAYEGTRLADQALRAGARGYLSKDEAESRLMEALRALACHQPYFSPGVSETLLRGFLQSNDYMELAQLTPRERQIVKLVAEGMSNKLIAHELNISTKTVETHRLAAMQKVGAKSAADLTRYAVRNDLVQL